MAAGNLNLEDSRLFNLNKEIERAKVIGADQEYANIAAVPVALKYPGKLIFDKDLGILYKIDTDGTTAIRQENILFEISNDSTTWYRYDNSVMMVDVKYIGLSGDGDTDNRIIIRVLHSDEITDILNRITTAEDSLSAHVARTDNPHGLTGDVIPYTEGEDTIANELSSKAGMPSGTAGDMIVKSATGDIEGTDAVKVSADQVDIDRFMKIGAGANTDVTQHTTSGSNYEIGINGDFEMYLKQCDKYHIIVGGDSVVVQGFSDDSDIPVGKFFTLVFINTSGASSTISFANIPWGANFDDIVLANGDKVMVTGYVYHRDEYLAKRVNFDNL